MYYTQEQIDRANQADLVFFLQSQGEQLTRAGNEYRWKRHDSLTVRGNKWYRHSQSKGGTLSSCTIRRYHRFISIVLSQAVKEGIIPFNAAARAEPPKVEKHEPNYLQPSTIPIMLEALDHEPLKWRMLVELMLVSGARRGEMLRLGEYYQRRGFVFSQDNGTPMHPDSVTTWLDRFSRRYGLPHITPHALRHAMTSLLIFNGVDIVSTAKRLGHSQVSTTSNIYAHVVEAADKKNADILGDILLKKA